MSGLHASTGRKNSTTVESKYPDEALSKKEQRRQNMEGRVNQLGNQSTHDNTYRAIDSAITIMKHTFEYFKQEPSASLSYSRKWEHSSSGTKQQIHETSTGIYKTRRKNRIDNKKP